MKYYVVNTPYACFSITVNNKIVIKAGRAGEWAVGRSLASMKAWVLVQGGSLAEYVCISKL